MENIVSIEYAPEGQVVSDFDLDHFVEGIKKSIKMRIAPKGVVLKSVVSTWIAFQRLRVAVLRGEIAAESVIFEFQNEVGTLDTTGQVEWSAEPTRWPRGCGDIGVDLCEELVLGQIKSWKEKRDNG